VTLTATCRDTQRAGRGPGGRRVYGARAVAKDLKVQFSGRCWTTPTSPRRSRNLEWTCRSRGGGARPGWRTLGHASRRGGLRLPEARVRRVWTTKSAGWPAVRNFITVRPPDSTEAVRGGHRAGFRCAGPRWTTRHVKVEVDRPHSQALRHVQSMRERRRAATHAGRRYGNRRGGQPTSGKALGAV